MEYRNEEARLLYEGKFFYKVKKFLGFTILSGPYENIYYINKNADYDPLTHYAFVQVEKSGAVLGALKDNEVLVTDRIL